MVRTDFYLGQYYDSEPDMLEAIWDIPYMAGVTNTADGIRRMHDMFLARRRPEVQQICILLTDGLSNLNHNDMIPNAEAAVADNIDIFAIGECLISFSTHSLTNLASFSGCRYSLVPRSWYKYCLCAVDVSLINEVMQPGGYWSSSGSSSMYASNHQVDSDATFSY